MTSLKLMSKEQELKDRYEMARAYLIETHQTLIDTEIMARLIDLIVEDMCQRVISVKKDIFGKNRALSKRELAKLYFHFTTSLDDGLDEVEGSRLMRAMYAYHKTGNWLMWDYAYKYKITGLNAAILLYLRYYTARGFNVLVYDDFCFMNKIERILVKYAMRYWYDVNVDVPEFEIRVRQIAEKAKLFYRRTFKGWG